jgi:hypothetical protein
MLILGKPQEEFSLEGLRGMISGARIGCKIPPIAFLQAIPLGYPSVSPV